MPNRKLTAQEKDNLLSSLSKLREKYDILDGGLSVQPDGTPAFVFVDCEKPLPPEWEGTRIIQRMTKKEETDTTEVIMSLEEALQIVQRLYSNGDATTHPDDAFRAGTLLALHYETKKKELTKGLLTRVVSSLS